MRPLKLRTLVTTAAALAMVTLSMASPPADAQPYPAQLGPRPFYLVDQLEPGPLKTRLQNCSDRPFFVKKDFSIGHRGAALQFPEHTLESYKAAARMGAGILECDVTITSDLELVCRHAQCDLHTTTNILATDLADSCLRPPDYDSETPFADVKCCTTDITLAEYKRLCGKMDASGGPESETLEEYLGGTADFRTDLYSTCGTVLSHAESIRLIRSLNRKFTPELKSPDAEAGLPDRITQEEYAQKLIDEYVAAGIPPEFVWAQSFNLEDVLYWIDAEPGFGGQAVFLEPRYDLMDESDPSADGLEPTMDELAASGVQVIAPPLWVLLREVDGEIVPSRYAESAVAAGLDIIAWTTERSGRIVEDVKEGGQSFYYLSTLESIENDGAILQTLDVLARDVGVLGVFSDWPATTTFYANCMDLD